MSNLEALERFVNQEHRDMAQLMLHIDSMHTEECRASGKHSLSEAERSSCIIEAFLLHGAAVIIRMRGLPYDCECEQIHDFFASGENSCTVLRVVFVKKPDGRATGDAFVLFANEADSPKALSKHRARLGSRYIELFRSTMAEVQEVLNTFPLIAPQVPFLPQRVITSGMRKDCVRLNRMPLEAQVEDILDFLGDHVNNIIFQGVHMVSNAQGKPSGEAFIQMDSEQSACVTAQQKHLRYMIFGNNKRYIEVFQCSGEDMNLVLTAQASHSRGF